MRKIILVLLIFISLKAFSFEIAGKVLDERYFPVPNISVSVTGGILTKTNKDGTFLLSTDNNNYNLLLFDLSSKCLLLFIVLTSNRLITKFVFIIHLTSLSIVLSGKGTVIVCSERFTFIWFLPLGW